MHRRPRRLLPLAALAAVLAAPAALADTVYVDASHAGCPGSGTAGDPFCAIKDGIDAALPGDVVLVAPGTYDELLDFLGKAITVRSSGGPGVTSIEPVFPNVGSVVTFASGEGAGSVLEGFTIRGGQGVVAGPFGETAGGGVFCQGSSPHIVGNVIEDNGAMLGGGIYCDGASPLIRGNTITSNGGEEGPGIHCINGAAPTISLNTISDHIFGSCCGGAISARSGSAPVIDGNVISGNQTSSAAAILLDEADATITNNTFSGNSTDEDEAGAIAAYFCTPTITDNLFASNSAFGRGGALVLGGCDGLVARNAFIDNFAVGEGGGAIATALGSTDTLVDNLFEGNQAGFGSALQAESPITVRRNTFRGGAGSAAIRCFAGTFEDNLIVDSLGAGVDAAGTAVLRRNTITGHFFDGIYVLSGAPVVESCIVWGNGLVPEIFVESGTVSVSHSDVGGGWAGPGNIDADPLFVDAPGGDHRLAAGSPCIDAGQPLDTVCGVDVAAAPRRLDGLLDLGSRVDMGAHEFSNIRLHASPPAVPGGAMALGTDGTAGLGVYVFAAAFPDVLCLEKYGTFLLDLDTPYVLAFLGNNPVAIAPTVPPSFSGFTILLQAVGLAPGNLTANTSNLVSVTFP